MDTDGRLLMVRLTSADLSVATEHRPSSIAIRKRWPWNNRKVAERLWARLEEWRAVANRYEKIAASFAGVLCVA